VKTWLVAMTLLLWSTMANAAVLKGLVSDATGAAVQNAYVFIFDDQARITTDTKYLGREAVTTRSGAFKVDVEPGFYDVCIFSSGFTPDCQKILVRTQNEEVLHDVRLVVDPLIVKERGDQFPSR
jgi:Carboxypeptidase regulatory-like domain